MYITVTLVKNARLRNYALRVQNVWQPFYVISTKCYVVSNELHSAPMLLVRQLSVLERLLIVYSDKLIPGGFSNITAHRSVRWTSTKSEKLLNASLLAISAPRALGNGTRHSLKRFRLRVQCTEIAKPYSPLDVSLLMSRKNLLKLCRRRRYIVRGNLSRFLFLDE